MDKQYDSKAAEAKWYAFWEQNKCFHDEPGQGKSYSVVIPPPNVTGILHMGHALNQTIQDILVRWHRMCGDNTLWLPGTDHAGIATQNVVEKALRKEGKRRQDLGREAFLDRVWEWKKQYGGTIVHQQRMLGNSTDWLRERFTFDEGCSRAVSRVFTQLYKEGLIYKGNYIVNWCPRCGTALANDEVEHEAHHGHLWYLRYPVAGSQLGVKGTLNQDYILLATTRPETLPGDTAVAVNPKDERFTALVGRKVILPLTGREIPILADDYVEKEFGTGIVKITPAHDPNDFEVGKRHNLEEIIVINDDATMNEKAGKYVGMDRYECRKALVADLEEMGLLVKVVPHSHNVGTHDRCHTTVEPMIKQQWFVKMDEMIKPAVEGVKNGEIKLLPKRMEKTYFNWTDNIRDWCISRQLWWGHRIPAWYCDDCGEMVVSIENPGVCPKCGCKHMTQDEDTLDTWFSSALWPFSTLGWPEKTEDLDYFYPNDVLVTGYDIIFFWVIRMIFSGYEQMGEAPFHTVLFHGLVRDSQGRKMSKSLGNGIDPLEVIDKYGADALRLTLITGNAPGNDMRFYWERVEASRNFANKVWNASRFILMNLDGKELTKPENDQLEAADKWIISKLNTLIAEQTANMDKFELGIAVQKVYDFIWDEFCDWYIEIVKPRIYAYEENQTSSNAALWTLKTVLSDALKLLHPFMPFITEEIFTALNPEVETIMLADWPVAMDENSFAKEEQMIEHLKDLVRGVRNVRTQMDVPVSRKAKLFITSDQAMVREAFELLKGSYMTLASASEVVVQEGKDGIGDDAVSVVIPDAVIYMPLEDLVDFEKEKERLLKEKKRLEGELKRSENMLSNEKFISKAPAAKIEEEKAKQQKYQQMMAQVEERLRQFEQK